MEVRSGIDALDDEIVSLLAARFRFIDAAARINLEDVRDETRKTEVIKRGMPALKAGIPDALITQLYEMLVRRFHNA